MYKLGCSAFARRYLQNRYCFLFLRLLRCFSSPGIASISEEIDTYSSSKWVPPFGNLRIITYLQFPVAYRC